ncbi:hypothetical protein BpHYR1_050819 [Brachionus plicatilis]|uniref:Uncharacterized protein n=1 Tax=Brachionus plicatilis TaxID=10195 RepID=A0A3M7T7S1_BRAPC|nr:hypothetical protein BpHYR1_050819 [Brachionus plicatilis]
MNFFSLVFLYTIVTTVSDTAPLLDVDQERIQRDKFYSLFEAKILEDELQNREKKRKKTRTITSLDDYNTMIVSIEEAYQKTRGRTQKEYYLVNKYEVYTVGDTKKIILKRKFPDDPFVISFNMNSYFRQYLEFTIKLDTNVAISCFKPVIKII